MRYITKFILSVIAVLFFVTGSAYIYPSRIYAQDACSSQGCVWVDCTYTSYQCDNIYGLNCRWVTIFKPKDCCQIPQQGGGSCTCCYDGGCYFNCPGTGGDGGDGGGGGEPPTPPTPTPPNPGTLTAVGRQVSPADPSCSAIQASATGVAGTTFGFSASSQSQPAPQTQVGNTPVTFSNVTPGWYTLVDTPPDSNYVFAQVCAYRDGVLYTLSRTGQVNGGETLSWELGYTYGSPWVQAEGGDVYASGTLRSYIPSGITPRVFVADGTSGYPGTVTYGSSFDFDASASLQGASNVSSTNWLVNATNTVVNYYDFFYRRFGAPTTPTTEPAFSNLLAVTEPPTSETPYYVVGDMTTSGNWNVGSGESIVILVNGNLTIGDRINITGNGFLAFIVNGNITVADTVGTGPTSTTSVVEGIYITSPTGTFATGASTAAHTSRFVGEGIEAPVANVPVGDVM